MNLNIVNRAYALVYRDNLPEMTAGPRMDSSDHILVVPAKWYNKKAEAFWEMHGFEWQSDTRTWQRNTWKPTREGKTYTTAAWLESTRREFFRFWPTLVTRKRCPLCSTRPESITRKEQHD